jgi:hypothetical protein
VDDDDEVEEGDEDDEHDAEEEEEEEEEEEAVLGLGVEELSPEIEDAGSAVPSGCAAAAV